MINRDCVKEEHIEVADILYAYKNSLMSFEQAVSYLGLPVKRAQPAPQSKIRLAVKSGKDLNTPG